MSCGVPVLCADRRVHRLNGTDKWFYGVLFNPCDAVDCADKIELLLGDDYLCEKISLDNRISAEKFFDFKKNIKIIEREIESIHKEALRKNG